MARMIRTSHGSKRKRSVLKQTKLQSTQSSSESNNSQSSKTSTKNSTDRYPNTSFPELPVGEGKIKQLPDGTISYDCEHYTQTWSLLRSTKRAEFFCEMASQLGVSPQEFRDILSRVDKRLARRRAHRRKKMRAAEEKKERQRKKKEAAEKRKLQKQQSQRSKKKQKKTKDGQKKSASAKNKASTGKTKGKAASMPVIPAQDKDTLIVERWFYDPPSSQGIQEIESLPRPPAPIDKSLHMSPATIIEALQDCYGPGHTEICTCGYSCYHIAVPPKTTQYVSERYLTHFCNPFGRGQFDLYRYSIKRLEKNHSAVYNHILKLCDLFFSLGFLEDDTWGRERVFAGYSRLLTFELIENVEYGRGRRAQKDTSSTYQYGTPLMAYHGCTLIEGYHTRQETEVPPYSVTMYDGVDNYLIGMKPGTLVVSARCLSVCDKKGRNPPKKEHLKYIG